MRYIFAMLLRTYIDDSSDERKEKAVSAGAYVGFYPQWNELSKRWRKRLKQEGLRYFRTTEYYSLRGEFSRYTDAQKYPKPKGREAAKAVLDDLEGIISKTEVVGVAVCIPVQLYNEIRKTEPNADKILAEDPFETAIQIVFMMCAEIARDNFDNCRVPFVCDDSSSSARIAVVHASFKEANPGLAEYMAGLVHRDDKKYLPIQAADLMAHIARRRFTEWIDDPDKKIFTANAALAERLKRLNVHKIGAWDRNYALAVLEHERKRRGMA